MAPRPPIPPLALSAPGDLAGYLEKAKELFAEHSGLLGWFAVVSLVLLAISLVALPFVISRLPADYFTEDGFARREEAKRAAHPTLVLLTKVARNVAGVLIALAGIAMLILPGQGLLAILVGIMLVDYPGKHRLERRLVARPAVHRPLNWLRRRTSKPPFIVRSPAS